MNFLLSKTDLFRQFLLTQPVKVSQYAKSIHLLTFPIKL